MRSGGGTNHRIGLFDAVLVKDNHIAAAGGVAAATRAALARADGLPVQVEVDSVDQAREALDAGATEILLDNFQPDEVRQAVAAVAGRARVEASGGITLDNVRAYGEAGADTVSVGAITHSAGALDIGLDVVSIEGVDGPAAAAPAG